MILDRAQNVTVRALVIDETAQCTQESIYAFARKPHSSVTGREFPRMLSESVHVQKEDPKQRGNDTQVKNLAVE